MKQKLLFLIILIILGFVFVNARQRGITRGAETGELYMSGYWYGIYSPGWGPPVFDTLIKAFYHITDYGKKLTLPYCADAFAHEIDYPYYDTTITIPWVVMADATSGVLYNRDGHRSYDLSVLMQGLWVSFDYGQTWTFREENPWPINYYTNNFEGLVYKTQYLGYDGTGVFQSTDYGDTWEKIGNREYGFDGECGLDSCDFFQVIGNYPYPGDFYYTNNMFETYTITPIDTTYVIGNMSGVFPDVYRGAFPGEVYVSSWFPDYTYKVSFSADTGRTFRVVYHSDSLYFLNENRTFFLFMSDREAGIFYIVYNELVEMDEPEGHYAKTCISYYTDYGETLVGTYCHDLMMNYPESCAGVLDMEAEVMNKNNVALRWYTPVTAPHPTAYRVYRNDTLLAELPQTEYFDENLPDGDYTYYVKAAYADGCESLSYNVVTMMVGFEGIVETQGIASLRVYPNPTSGELIIGTSAGSVTNGVAGQARNDVTIENIEIFDLMGRVVMSVTSPPSGGLGGAIDISSFPAGMYFVRITTENGMITQKIVKR